jgi:hypothetical protein
MSDDVAHQWGGIHSFGQLGNDTVAGLRADAAEVDFCRRIGPGADQPFADNELGDLRTLDQSLEARSQPAAVRSAGRRRQPNQRNTRIGIDDLEPSAGADVMALVDNDQVSRRRVHAFGAHHTRPVGLHRRHLHRLVWPYRVGCHDDAVSDAGGVQLERCLLDDFAGVRQHQHALALGDCAAGDFCGDDGLAGAGRCDQTNVGNTDRQFLPALVDHVELIRAQLGHGTSPSVQELTNRRSSSTSASLSQPSGDIAVQHVSEDRHRARLGATDERVAPHRTDRDCARRTRRQRRAHVKNRAQGTQ